MGNTEPKTDSKELKQSCPDFPFFGAKYPDATCIDGKLWDLDNCDENGLISSDDNPPCPFCNTDAFLNYIVDTDEKDLADIHNNSTLSEEDKKEILESCMTKEKAILLIEAIKNKYS